MTTIVNFNNDFEMPLNLQTVEDFRRWSHSRQFPEGGRIDYVEGRIEVDTSPEDLFTHGTPKGDIFAALHGLVRQQKLGHLFVDRTRIVSTAAGLSAEPDIVFVSQDAIATGRVRLIPKASGEPDRFIELEGGVDLIVEIVSDSSERKDNQHLRGAYFRAGVREYWLVDVRGEAIQFRIHRRDESGFLETEEDHDGFRSSEVLESCFRLRRRRSTTGYWEYDLDVRGR